MRYGRPSRAGRFRLDASRRGGSTTIPRPIGYPQNKPDPAAAPGPECETRDGYSMTTTRVLRLWFACVSFTM